MRRRNKKNPLLMRIIVVSILFHIIALPILTSYALAKRKPRKLKRLYDKRGSMMKTLREEFAKANA